MVSQSGLPVQRACQAVGLSRATYYRPVVNWAQRDGPVIEALTTLGATKPRWGFWKYVDRLRNTGHRWNHNRLWRVYCQLRLNLPRRTKKRLPVRFRQPLVVIPQPNAVWAVDFMSDTLYGGRRFRTLNILDEGVREGLVIEIDTSLPAERVIRVLEQVVAWRGQPQAIRLDNVLYPEVKRAEQTHLSSSAATAVYERSAVPPNGASIFGISAGHSGSFSPLRVNGGRKAATILSWRYSSSR
jgi:putative transposase